MIYDGTIRVKSSINTKYLKEMSQTLNCLKRQSGYEALSKTVRYAMKAITPLYTPSHMESFSNAVTLFENSISKNSVQYAIDVYENLKYVLSDCMDSMQKVISCISSFHIPYRAYERGLFFKIAYEIGYPIYLEVNTELQDRLIKSYIENGNQCNKKEMREIILDYYNDGYIDQVLNGIKNVNIFNVERVGLIEEGIETYQLGLYGSSASLFAAQLSGMIRDVYNELSTFHKISRKEKNELLVAFNQNCTPDSEKGMLLQIVNSQTKTIMLWYKVLLHFLNFLYSTKNNDIATQPNRNMICHGKQTNYNTKEMNVKLILYMDIIADLAWRVKDMKEEYSGMIIDV